MATTKKPRSRKKRIAPSKPDAATRVDEPKVPQPRRGRTFHIHLIEGTSYSSRGFNFVAGRPLVTADEKIYEAFRGNGRLRIDVREGGAK